MDSTEPEKCPVDLTEKPPETLIMNTAKSHKYPKIVILILMNQFCERYSNYGMRTVLYIYLTSFVGQTKDSATVIFHTFTILVQFTPILGAILADGFIGLYATILYLSLLYALGFVILTVTSLIPLGAPNLAGPCVALFIIAIGSGGVKPCITAFGANQFDASQKKQIQLYFSVLFVFINVGCTIGNIITPILRSDIKCFGSDCYPMAFGLTTFTMIISLIFFVSGTRLYKRIEPTQRGLSNNILVKTCGCIFRALINKAKSRIYRKKQEIPKQQWLDYAEDKYPKELISDVKVLCKVLLVFLPVPIFWALYDQYGSRWTDQALQLDGQLGSVLVKPDQFQATNPIFCILLVPLFEMVIYPAFARFNLLKRPLQRMTVGLILAIVSFIIAAVLESQMQAKFEANNPRDQLKIVNLSPCDISAEKFSVHPNEQFTIEEPIWDDIGNLNAGLNCSYKLDYSISNRQLPMSIVFYADSVSIQALELATNFEDLVIGASQLRLIPLNLNFDLKTSLVDQSTISKLNVLASHDFNNTEYLAIDYSINYKFELFNGQQVLLSMNQIKMETCGKYTMLIYQNSVDGSYQTKLLTDIRPSGLSLFWQLIQVFVITLAEIMFSVPGVQFAYSQASPNMKSVLQAAWFLTIAFGNLVVVIVAEAKFVENQVWEYVLFAGLLAVATGIFGLLAYRYQYVEDLDEGTNAAKAAVEMSSLDQDHKQI